MLDILPAKCRTFDDGWLGGGKDNGQGPARCGSKPSAPHVGERVAATPFRFELSYASKLQLSAPANTI